MGRLSRVSGLWRCSLRRTVPRQRPSFARSDFSLSNPPAVIMIPALEIPGGMAEHRDIYFLWRPFLQDADDEMVLELAVAGRATHIITFNQRDVAGVSKAFGVQVMTPARFMASLQPKP